MSVERAKNKDVVTLLSPRKKNNDVADNKKAEILEKETIDKPFSVQDNSERRSSKPGPSLKSSCQAEGTPSPLAQTTFKQEVAVTPKTSSKEVSVKSSIYSVTSNVFAPSRNVGSPLRMPRYMSPPVYACKVEMNVERLTPCTPENIPEKPKQKNIGRTPVEVDVTGDRYKQARKNLVNTVPSALPYYAYRVPSVTESNTEDIVMAGTVPLQAASSAPKSLVLLKNEFKSENAEIVSLLLPSKVRPTLRPVPKLAPLRRSSVLASASEVEDESRRAVLSGGGASTPAPPRQGHDPHTSHRTIPSPPNRNRISNELVCSSVVQARAHSPAASSFVKDKHLSISRRVDMSRRQAAMRRRRETDKKDPLTMYDLIFTNPPGNPIVPQIDEFKVQQVNDKEARKAAIKQVEHKVEGQVETSTEAPVPQVKLGPNGEILLDEKSLVIKQSEKRKLSSAIVHEAASGTSSTSCGYRRKKHTTYWNEAETLRFYRALAMLGTDFMLMEKLFPGRTRRDLKLKFKREVRVNKEQVYKALCTTCKWDAAGLEKEFRAERDEASNAAQQLLKQRAKDQRWSQKEARELQVRADREEEEKEIPALQLQQHTIDQLRKQKDSWHPPVRRLSRAAKSLGASALPSPCTALTADELLRQYQEAKAQENSTASSQFPTSIRVASTSNDMATIRKIDTKSQCSMTEKQPATTPGLRSNIEAGSSVAFPAIDLNSPLNKMWETYMASERGRLTPVNVSTSFLKAVVTCTSSMSSGSSPHWASPSSAPSQDSWPYPTPGMI